MRARYVWLRLLCLFIPRKPPYALLVAVREGRVRVDSQRARWLAGWMR